VLRALIVLDLESHPPALGIDAVTIAIEPTASRVVQGSLLTRTVPAPEQLSPLLARLGALMGEERCGAASLVDSYRPGAFRVTPFSVNPSPARNSHSPPPTPHLPLPPPHSPPPAVRRYRVPVAARVTVQEGRPVLVRTDRRGIAGGRVEACAGPWRTSGEWWGPPSLDGASRVPAGQVCGTGWNRDEWDVALGDGAVYRLFEDRESARWFIEGVVD
jgi:protein ImuB